MIHLGAEERRKMISEAAYFRAERRGFVGGDPVRDWLDAENEVNAALARHDLLAALEERLEIANDKLQSLRKRFSDLKASGREELAQDLATIVKLRDGLARKVELVRLQGEQASDKAKQQAEKALNQAEKAWEQISRAFDRMAARKSEHVD